MRVHCEGEGAVYTGLRPVGDLDPVYLKADQALSAAIEEGLVGSRTSVIAAYALCGFAHLPSVGIFVGGITALEGSTAGSLGKVALRALFAATLACLMTGAVAGTFHGIGESVLSAGGG